MSVRDQIGDWLAEIKDRDPDGLAGIRTITEVAERFSTPRDTVRYYLDGLIDEGRVRCVGKLIGEPGRLLAFAAI